MSEVISVTPETTYAEAAKIMHDQLLASVPVRAEDGTLVGILSEKDLFRAMYPEYAEYYENPQAVTDEEEFENKIKELRNQPVSTFMTKDVLTVDSHEPIMKAGSLMLTCHFHHLPVVDGGKFVGMVSREKVFTSILKAHLGF